MSSADIGNESFQCKVSRNPVRSVSSYLFIHSRFPAPAYARDRRHLVMAEIERQASQSWGMGKAIAALDFMKIDIPVRMPDAAGTSNGSVSNTKNLYDEDDKLEETDMDDGRGERSRPSVSASDAHTLRINSDHLPHSRHSSRGAGSSRGRPRSAHRAHSPYARSPHSTTFDGTGGKASRGGGASPYPYQPRGRGQGSERGGADDDHRYRNRRGHGGGHERHGRGGWRARGSGASSRS